MCLQFVAGLIIVCFLTLVAKCQDISPRITTKQAVSHLSGPTSLYYDNNSLYILNTLQQTLLNSNLQNTISTIVGGINNTSGFNGDGKLALETTFSNPSGLFITNSTLYISDTFNQRLRSINRESMKVDTIAGDGNCGFLGDGTQVGLGNNVQVCNPKSIFVDDDQEIYFADSFNNRIRKIDSNKVITTVAGSSSYGGFSGDGGDPTKAQVFRPESVFVFKNGNTQQEWMLIADTYNNRIRKIENGKISTIAGGNTQGYNGDGILAKDALLCRPSFVYGTSSGLILVADYCNHKIRVIYTNGTIDTLPINVRYPKSIYFDEHSKFLFISEYIDGNVQQVTFSCPTGYAVNDNLSCGPVCQSSCSNRGKCIAPEVCQCEDRYYGEYCQEYTCYGVEKNHPLVCSGHGTCVGPDSCQCDTNYHNRNCSETTCFGLNSTEPNVCSGHGNCTLFNTCQCQINHFGGHNCQIPLCNGRNSSDPFVCSGNGFCFTDSTPALCVCTRGGNGAYVGTDCQFPTCLSIPSYEESSVCYGHGTCTGFNHCKCGIGYDGQFCEVSQCGSLCKGLAVGFCVILLLIVSVLCLACLILKRINRKKGQHNKEEYGLIGLTATSEEMQQLNYIDIAQDSAPITIIDKFIPIDQFRIPAERELGSGAQGKVYKAKYHPNGLFESGDAKEIAIKVLDLPEYDATLGESARKEFLNWTRLDHPNIVKCLGYSHFEFKSGSKKYGILMELLPGTLLKFIRDMKQRVSFEWKLQIMIGIMSGVQYLHTDDITMIHRDLKPANILIDYQKDEEGNVKSVEKVQLADMGLLSLGGKAVTYVGTKGYMAPEVLNRNTEEHYTTSVDIYSCGIVMLEIFVEETPYKNWKHENNVNYPEFPFKVDDTTGIENWLTELRKTDLQLYSEETLIETIQQLMSLIEKCVTKTPSERPSAPEVLSTLTQIYKSLLQSKT